MSVNDSLPCVHTRVFWQLLPTFFNVEIMVILVEVGNWSLTYRYSPSNLLPTSSNHNVIILCKSCASQPGLIRISSLWACRHYYFTMTNTSTHHGMSCKTWMNMGVKVQGK